MRWDTENALNNMNGRREKVDIVEDGFCHVGVGVGGLSVRHHGPRVSLQAAEHDELGSPLDESVEDGVLGSGARGITPG